MNGQLEDCGERNSEKRESQLEAKVRKGRGSYLVADILGAFGERKMTFSPPRDYLGSPGAAHVLGVSALRGQQNLVLTQECCSLDLWRLRRWYVLFSVSLGESGKKGPTESFFGEIKSI